MDRIVAKVGTEIILLSDLQKQISQLASTGIDPQILYPENVLGQIIEQKLLVQKAKELNIAADEDAITKYAERYLNDIKSRYPSEADFQVELRKMNTTQRELLKFLADQIRENYLTEQLIEKYISSRIKITEPEMRSFYETSKDSLAVKPTTWELSLILREIRPSVETQERIIAETETLLEKLKAGEDFAALAEEYSDCPSSQQGGDLGYFKRGMMVKPFEDAAFSLNINEISEIVQSNFGYHIIKLTDRRGDEIRASHILKIVQAGEDDSDRERALMQEIRDRIVAGESFGDLAREYSFDTNSKDDGGLLGEFGEQDLPELFLPVIMASEVGVPTEVLQNEGLVYIFIRENESAARVFEYDEVKDQLKDYLFQLRQMEYYDEWMQEAKSKAFIEYKL
ncbi:MAG: peptidylprolyl isomerase [Candidatus Cloacimonetes bacterium]|nr:peptidylprolyl isomerase [Candidatus Cloacimonadota bacterium]